MEDYNDEITKIRDKEIKKIIFDPILAKLGNKNQKKQYRFKDNKI